MASRARWMLKYERGLVDILHENNVPRYRSQNGWKIEGWRKIVKDFDERFPDAKFNKVQIKEHEAQLKRDYKLIKSILQRSDVLWDQNASMIKATDDVWDEIIVVLPKARKYQTKNFPLFESLGLLYEGLSAEEEHNLTSSRPLRVADACNINTLEVTAELGSQGLDVLDLLQNHKEEALGSPQHGVCPQPHRNDEPAHSSSCIEPQQKEKSKKRKSAAIQHTMDVSHDFRTKQARMREQATRHEEEFSISRCIKALHSMVDVSDEVKILASDVFKDAANREIFLSYEPKLRTLWLKKEVDKFLF